jgi:CMP-N-acetylneuraminic acid synthetase
MRNLGLIPARGGSKGIPGKNLVDLGGKPLIAWTVDAALASGVLDAVIITTDDPNIADAAVSAGAECPFMRPAELAADETPTLAVVQHSLEWLARDGREVLERVVLLQPTSPFRTATDIRACVELHSTAGVDGVISLVEAEVHPQWAFEITAEGGLRRMVDDVMPTRRQDLSSIYRPNGAVYVARPQALRAGASFYDGDIRGWVMPPQRSIDIDTSWDLTIARLIAAAFAEGAIPAGQWPGEAG